MADTSSGSAKAGFNIPKIKKTNKDNLQIVGLNTRDVKELLLDINKHCLNTNFMSEIDVISVKMVHNSELMDKYYKKKGEMKDQGRSNASLTDQLGFLHMKHYLLDMVVKNGLCCTHQHFNRLGKGECGVYLNRYFDVEVSNSFSLLKNEVGPVEFFVFKYFPGKCKSITIGNLYAQSTTLEPTPNYDSHNSSVSPKLGDTIFTQMARSMIYLYEYTEDCVPAKYPRHCCPFAIVKIQRKMPTEMLSPPLIPMALMVIPKSGLAATTSQSPGELVLAASNSKTKSTAIPTIISVRQKSGKHLSEDPPSRHVPTPPLSNTDKQGKGVEDATVGNKNKRVTHTSTNECEGRKDQQGTKNGMSGADKKSQDLQFALAASSLMDKDLGKMSLPEEDSISRKKECYDSFSKPSDKSFRNDDKSFRNDDKSFRSDDSKSSLRSSDATKRQRDNSTTKTLQPSSVASDLRDPRLARSLSAPNIKADPRLSRPQTCADPRTDPQWPNKGLVSTPKEEQAKSLVTDVKNASTADLLSSSKKQLHTAKGSKKKMSYSDYKKMKMMSQHSKQDEPLSSATSSAGSPVKELAKPIGGTQGDASNNQVRVIGTSSTRGDGFSCRYPGSGLKCHQPLLPSGLNPITHQELCSSILHETPTTSGLVCHPFKSSSTAHGRDAKNKWSEINEEDTYKSNSQTGGSTDMTAYSLANKASFIPPSLTSSKKSVKSKSASPPSPQPAKKTLLPLPVFNTDGTVGSVLRGLVDGVIVECGSLPAKSLTNPSSSVCPGTVKSLDPHSSDPAANCEASITTSDKQDIASTSPGVSTSNNKPVDRDLRQLTSDKTNVALEKNHLPSAGSKKIPLDKMKIAEASNKSLTKGFVQNFAKVSPTALQTVLKKTDNGAILAGEQGNLQLLNSPQSSPGPTDYTNTAMDTKNVKSLLRAFQKAVSVLHVVSPLTLIPSQGSEGDEQVRDSPAAKSDSTNTYSVMLSGDRADKEIPQGDMLTGDKADTESEEISIESMEVLPKDIQLVRAGFPTQAEKWVVEKPMPKVLTLSDLGFKSYLKILSRYDYQPSVLLLDFKQNIAYKQSCSVCKSFRNFTTGTEKVISCAVPFSDQDTLNPVKNVHYKEGQEKVSESTINTEAECQVSNEILTLDKVPTVNSQQINLCAEDSIGNTNHMDIHPKETGSSITLSELPLPASPPSSPLPASQSASPLPASPPTSPLPVSPPPSPLPTACSSLASSPRLVIHESYTDLMEVCTDSMDIHQNINKDHDNISDGLEIPMADIGRNITDKSNNYLPEDPFISSLDHDPYPPVLINKKTCEIICALLMSAPKEAPAVLLNEAPAISSKEAPSISSKGAPVISSEAPAISSKGAPAISSKEAPAISSKEAPAISPKGAPPISSKDAPTSSPKEAPACSTKEAPSISPKEAPACSTKEAPAISSKKVSAISIKEAPDISSKEAPACSTKEAPSISPKEAPACPTKEAPAISSKKVSAISIKEAPDILSKEAPAISSKKVSAISIKETPDISSKEAPACSTKETPSISPKEAPACSTKEAPAISSKKVSAISIKEAPHILSKEAPAISSKKVSAISLKEAPDISSKEAQTISLNKAPAISLKEALHISSKESSDILLLAETVPLKKFLLGNVETAKSKNPQGLAKQHESCSTFHTQESSNRIGSPSEVSDEDLFREMLLEEPYCRNKLKKHVDKFCSIKEVSKNLAALNAFQNDSTKSEEKLSNPNMLDNLKDSKQATLETIRFFSETSLTNHLGYNVFSAASDDQMDSKKSITLNSSKSFSADQLISYSSLMTEQPASKKNSSAGDLTSHSSSHLLADCSEKLSSQPFTTSPPPKSSVVPTTRSNSLLLSTHKKMDRSQKNTSQKTSTGAPNSNKEEDGIILLQSHSKSLADLRTGHNLVSESQQPSTSTTKSQTLIYEKPNHPLQNHTKMITEKPLCFHQEKLSLNTEALRIDKTGSCHLKGERPLIQLPSSCHQSTSESDLGKNKSQEGMTLTGLKGVENIESSQRHGENLRTQEAARNTASQNTASQCMKTKNSRCQDPLSTQGHSCSDDAVTNAWCLPSILVKELDLASIPMPPSPLTNNTSKKKDETRKYSEGLSLQDNNEISLSVSDSCKKLSATIENKTSNSLSKPVCTASLCQQVWSENLTTIGSSHPESQSFVCHAANQDAPTHALSCRIQKNIGPESQPSDKVTSVDTLINTDFNGKLKDKQSASVSTKWKLYKSNILKEQTQTIQDLSTTEHSSKQPPLNVVTGHGKLPNPQLAKVSLTTVSSITDVATSQTDQVKQDANLYSPSHPTSSPVTSGFGELVPSDTSCGDEIAYSNSGHCNRTPLLAVAGGHEIVPTDEQPFGDIDYRTRPPVTNTCPSSSNQVQPIMGPVHSVTSNSTGINQPNQGYDPKEAAMDPIHQAPVLKAPNQMELVQNTTELLNLFAVTFPQINPVAFLSKVCEYFQTNLLLGAASPQAAQPMSPQINHTSNFLPPGLQEKHQQQRTTLSPNVVSHSMALHSPSAKDTKKLAHYSLSFPSNNLSSLESDASAGGLSTSFQNTFDFNSAFLRNTEANSLRNMEANILRNTEANSLRNTEANSLRNMEANSLRNTEANSLRNTEANSLRNTEANSLRNTEANSLRNTEANSLRNTDANSLWSLTKSKSVPSNSNEHNNESIKNTVIQCDNLTQKSVSEKVEEERKPDIPGLDLIQPQVDVTEPSLVRAESAPLQHHRVDATNIREDTTSFDPKSFWPDLIKMPTKLTVEDRCRSILKAAQETVSEQKVCEAGDVGMSDDDDVIFLRPIIKTKKKINIQLDRDKALNKKQQDIPKEEVEEVSSVLPSLVVPEEPDPFHNMHVDEHPVEPDSVHIMNVDRLFKLISEKIKKATFAPKVTLDVNQCPPVINMLENALKQSYNKLNDRNDSNETREAEEKLHVDCNPNSFVKQPHLFSSKLKDKVTSHNIQPNSFMFPKLRNSAASKLGVETLPKNISRSPSTETSAHDAETKMCSPHRIVHPPSKWDHWELSEDSDHAPRKGQPFSPEREKLNCSSDMTPKSSSKVKEKSLKSQTHRKPPARQHSLSKSSSRSPADERRSHISKFSRQSSSSDSSSSSSDTESTSLSSSWSTSQSRSWSLAGKNSKKKSGHVSPPKRYGVACVNPSPEYILPWMKPSYSSSHSSLTSPQNNWRPAKKRKVKKGRAVSSTPSRSRSKTRAPRKSAPRQRDPGYKCSKLQRGDCPLSSDSDTQRGDCPLSSDSDTQNNSRLSSPTIPSAGIHKYSSSSSTATSPPQNSSKMSSMPDCHYKTRPCDPISRGCLLADSKRLVNKSVLKSGRYREDVHSSLRRQSSTQNSTLSDSSVTPNYRNSKKLRNQARLKKASGRAKLPNKSNVPKCKTKKRQNSLSSMLREKSSAERDSDVVGLTSSKSEVKIYLADIPIDVLSLAREKILNEINQLNDTSEPVTPHTVGSRTSHGEMHSRESINSVSGMTAQHPVVCSDIELEDGEISEDFMSEDPLKRSSLHEDDEQLLAECADNHNGLDASNMKKTPHQNHSAHKSVNQIEKSTKTVRLKSIVVQPEMATSSIGNVGRSNSVSNGCVFSDSDDCIILEDWTQDEISRNGQKQYRTDHIDSLSPESKCSQRYVRVSAKEYSGDQPDTAGWVKLNAGKTCKKIGKSKLKKNVKSVPSSADQEGNHEVNISAANKISLDSTATQNTQCPAADGLNTSEITVPLKASLGLSENLQTENNLMIKINNKTKSIRIGGDKETIVINFEGEITALPKNIQVIPSSHQVHECLLPLERTKSLANNKERSIFSAKSAKLGAKAQAKKTVNPKPSLNKQRESSETHQGSVKSLKKKQTLEKIMNKNSKQTGPVKNKIKAKNLVTSVRKNSVNNENCHETMQSGGSKRIKQSEKLEVQHSLTADVVSRGIMASDLDKNRKSPHSEDTRGKRTPSPHRRPGLNSYSHRNRSPSSLRGQSSYSWPKRNFSGSSSRDSTPGRYRRPSHRYENSRSRSPDCWRRMSGRRSSSRSRRSSSRSRRSSSRSRRSSRSRSPTSVSSYSRSYSSSHQSSTKRWRSRSRSPDWSMRKQESFFSPFDRPGQDFSSFGKSRLDSLPSAKHHRYESSPPQRLDNSSYTYSASKSTDELWEIYNNSNNQKLQWVGMFLDVTSKRKLDPSCDLDYYRAKRPKKEETHLPANITNHSVAQRPANDGQLNVNEQGQESKTFSNNSDAQLFNTLSNAVLSSDENSDTSTSTLGETRVNVAIPNLTVRQFIFSQLGFTMNETQASKLPWPLETNLSELNLSLTEQEAIMTETIGACAHLLQLPKLINQRKFNLEVSDWLPPPPNTSDHQILLEVNVIKRCQKILMQQLNSSLLYNSPDSINPSAHTSEMEPVPEKQTGKGTCDEITKGMDQTSEPFPEPQRSVGAALGLKIERVEGKKTLPSGISLGDELPPLLQVPTSEFSFDLPQVPLSETDVNNIKVSLERTAKDLLDLYQSQNFGLAHYPVPDLLLLHEELGQVYDRGGCFLVLSSSLPSKVFVRLIYLRIQVEDLQRNTEMSAIQKNKEIHRLCAERSRILNCHVGMITKKKMRSMSLLHSNYRICKNYLLSVIGKAGLKKLNLFESSLKAVVRHYQQVKREFLQNLNFPPLKYKSMERSVIL